MRGLVMQRQQLLLLLLRDRLLAAPFVGHRSTPIHLYGEATVTQGGYRVSRLEPRLPPVGNTMKVGRTESCDQRETLGGDTIPQEHVELCPVALLQCRTGSEEGGDGRETACCRPPRASQDRSVSLAGSGMLLREAGVCVWLTDRDQGLFLELARELCPGCRILRRRVDRLHVLCRDDRVGRVRCGHCRALFFFLAGKVWLARQRVGGGRGRLSRQAIRRARASSKHCHRQSVCGPGSSHAIA